MLRREFLVALIASLWSLRIRANPLADDVLYNAKVLSDIQKNGLQRLAFGSCSKAKLDQSYWAKIQAKMPQAWLWLGDINYLKTDKYTEQFDALKNNSYYNSFIKTLGFYSGTWDDNDFGYTPENTENPDKVLVKEAILDFLYRGADEIKSLIREDFGNDTRGIYHSSLLGPTGRQAHIIMTDTRFDKIVWDNEYQLMEEKQWDWLTNEVLSSPAQVIFIASGSQIFAQFGSNENYWGSFPIEKARLKSLIGQKLAQNPMTQIIFLSGDKHYGEVLSEPIKGKLVFEFTSSGLTHNTPFSIGGGNRVKHTPSKNYGLIEIDWSKARPKVQFKAFEPYTNRELFKFTNP